MKDRIILHVDMDYFFAQVEERENPQFKRKPLVIGANPKEGKGRGVVSTANYEARKYGIHSALPISKAYQLFSQAIFLPPNKTLYQEVSEKIMQIIKSYSKSGKFEQVSLDEAYLDLSLCVNSVHSSDYGERLAWEKAKDLAEKLKAEIFKKEKLTSSVGLGPNKLIAKMAAEKAKPNGLLVIKPTQIKKFLEPLEIEDLTGIGPKTAEKLRALKVNKIRDLKKLSKSRLIEMFGMGGETIYERARGIDREEVVSARVVKSIHKEHTFYKDTKNPKIIFETFEKLIKNVYQRLLKENFSFRSITVICRYHDFETRTKSETLKEPTQDLETLNKIAKKLLLRFLTQSPKLVRLIGLRISLV